MTTDASGKNESRQPQDRRAFLRCALRWTGAAALAGVAWKASRGSTGAACTKNGRCGDCSQRGSCTLAETSRRVPVREAR